MIPFGMEIVTLYNRHETKDENGRTVAIWYRTVLAGCSWTLKRIRAWDGTAVILTDEITCRIPEDARYRSPAEWDALVVMTSNFTLAPGDIIVRGSVTDEIVAAFKASDLIAKYRRAGVMTVNAAQDNFRLGFPIGHYCAKGA